MGPKDENQQIYLIACLSISVLCRWVTAVVATTTTTTGNGSLNALTEKQYMPNCG